jgi:hypothetical protein
MLAYLAYLNVWVALGVAVSISPILIWRAILHMRLVFFQPYTSSDATTGHTTQYWRIKTTWRNIFKRQPIPGKPTRKEQIEDLPPELQEAIRNSINLNENRGKMPITKVSRVPVKGRKRHALSNRG